MIYDYLLEASDVFIRYAEHMSMTEYRALLLIAKKGEATVSEVAQFLDVPSSTASRICDQLDARGTANYPGYALVEVVPSRDRRQKLLKVSSKGKALFDDLQELMLKPPEHLKPAIRD